MGSGSSSKKKVEVEEPLDFKAVHSAIRWNKPLEMLKGYYTKDTSSVSLQDDKNGNFPLHIAAQNGFTDHVQLLLDHNADINCINNKGNTPLHMAWSYDYIETAELLVKLGANVNQANDAGYRAAMGIDGDKCRAIVYLFASKTTADILAAFDMFENAPEDTDKATFVSKCMTFKKKLASPQVDDDGKEIEKAKWTPECDTRMKEVMAKLS